MRVLVIDDERPMLRIVEGLLAGSGRHEVMTALSASDAFFYLAAVRGPFDVILCDLHLPEMGGKEFLSRLSPLQAARVVFMTGGSCGPADNQFLSKRAVLYKPFTAPELEAALGAIGHRTAA
jgi:CheY-like chemotaxis protein